MLEQAHVHMTAQLQNADLWHLRYGHLGYNNIERLVSLGMAKGVKTDAAQFRAAHNHVSEPCVLAKQHGLPFKA